MGIMEELKELQETCCSCGNHIHKDDPKYCENCYQDLIAQNAGLQLQNHRIQLDNNLPYYMSKVGSILENPDIEYTYEDRIIDLMRVYLEYTESLKQNTPIIKEENLGNGKYNISINKKTDHVNDTSIENHIPRID